MHASARYIHTCFKKLVFPGQIFSAHRKIRPALRYSPHWAKEAQWYFLHRYRRVRIQNGAVPSHRFSCITSGRWCKSHRKQWKWGYDLRSELWRSRSEREAKKGDGDYVPQIDQRRAAATNWCRSIWITFQYPLFAAQHCSQRQPRLFHIFDLFKYQQRQGRGRQWNSGFEWRWRRRRYSRAFSSSSELVF